MRYKASRQQKRLGGLHESQISTEDAKLAITSVLAELAETMNRKERKV